MRFDNCRPMPRNSSAGRRRGGNTVMLAALMASICGPSAAWQAHAQVAQGLQLTIAAGSNTENLTGAELMLNLLVTVRNNSARPIVPEFEQATYNFEYEFDGTWYAFEPRAAAPLSGQDLRNDPAYRELVLAIAAGAQKMGALAVPLAARSPALQLRAITADGQGKRFEPAPGPHAVRVRPAAQPALVSNFVTVSFRTPARVDFSSQSVTFAPSPDTPLRELRFVSGPADGQAVIREVLARPPNPGSIQRLINAPALQILAPLPYYDLLLPRRLGAPDPSLPATSGLFHYIVSSGDQVEATLSLASNRDRSVLHWIGDASASESVLRALHELAGMTEVRGGAYEPRLLRITGARGTSPVLMLWLHSASGSPDLFYRPRDPHFRGVTKVEGEKLYSLEALLQAARTLPVAPRHDEAWAVRATMECARTTSPTYGGTFAPEQAVVEIGVNDKQDGVVWHVFVPELRPTGGRVMLVKPEPGVAMLVDEADGSCKPVARE